MALSAEQEKWFAEASSLLTCERLGEAVCRLVDIPSPPGQERVLAEAIVAGAAEVGLAAQLQPIVEDHANAILRYGAGGDGPTLMLFSPIDSHLTGLDAYDVPMAGAVLPDAVRPNAQVEGPFVVGLGANNPKGHAACIAVVLEALAEAEVPLSGQVIGAFAGGGMPTNGGPEVGAFPGNGSGCAFMLERAVQPDAAVIAKPGSSVSWDEVGLIWARVRIAGRMGYVGIRHRVQAPNPIVEAARVIPALEKFVASYSARHTTGTIAPQGAIGAIQGGWPYKPAFSPAVCDLFVDLRVHPDTSPAAAFGELANFVATQERLNGDFKLETELLLAVPGTASAEQHPVVQACTTAWERVHERSHTKPVQQSGATDANVLRRVGIPTARVGMPPLAADAPGETGFTQSMNVVDTREMEKLARILMHVVISTCGIRARTASKQGGGG